MRKAQNKIVTEIASTNMTHIYLCKLINNKKTSIDYNEIYNENLNTQIEIFKRMERNLEKENRSKTNKNTPCDPSYC